MTRITRMRRAVRALHDERGLTLVELLVAMVLAIIVLGLGLMMLNFALRSESELSARTAKTAQGRTMMESLTRELRQSSSVSVATPTRVVFLTWVKSATCGGAPATTSIQCQVEYSCTGGTCTRVERNTNGTGGGGAYELVEGLLSNNVFTYTPSPSAPEYVTVTLSFPADPNSGGSEDAVTLQDGAHLRNSPL